MGTNHKVTQIQEGARQHALDLLRSKGSSALREVEALLGHKGPGGMTDAVMAERLGITRGQLRYLFFRSSYLEQEKERRRAEKQAKAIDFTIRTSHKLRFAISLPVTWRVYTDTMAPANVAEGLLTSMDSIESAATAYERQLETERAKVPAFASFKAAYAHDRIQAYKLFFADLLGMPQDKSLQLLAERELSPKAAYESLLKDPGTFLVGFDDFKRQYDADLGERKGAAKRRESLERMQIGLFQAGPTDTEDAFGVEVSKLRMATPLTSMELYQMDKHPPQDVPWGSRPANGMRIDGLQGVVYYYLLNTGDKPSEQPVFFNVYLTDQHEGWIISCECKYGDFYFKTFNNYKPIFRRIVRSFRRIHTIDKDGM